MRTKLTRVDNYKSGVLLNTVFYNAAGVIVVAPTLLNFGQVCP